MGKSYFFKVIVIGEGGVGKTTLLRRYIHDRFEDTAMTVGVEFYVKQIELDNNNYTLQLWDLAGQERFRHLLDNFVMGAKGAILALDLTKMPRENSVKNFVELARMYNPNLPILLIGTKLDLEDFIAMDDTEALALKKYFKMMDYIKTSSKTGHNVNEVFETLAKNLIKNGKA